MTSADLYIANHIPPPKDEFMAIHVLPGNGMIAEYIPFADFAKEWKVSMETMYAWRRRGKLPEAVKIGRDWYLPGTATRPEPKQRGVKCKYEDS